MLRNRLKRTLILSFSGIALVGIGLISGSNPNIQNSVQNAESHIEIPLIHADNSNTFSLSKSKTTKQFTASLPNVGHNYSLKTDSKLNKKATRKMNKYLNSVNNISDYNLYFSRINTSPSASNNLRPSVTVTVTFIRR